MKVKDIILYVLLSVCIVCSVCAVVKPAIEKSAKIKEAEVITNATYKWVSFTEYYEYERISGSVGEWRASDERVLSQCWYKNGSKKIAYSDNSEYRNINITIAYYCIEGVLRIEGTGYYTDSERDMVYLNTKGYWSKNKDIFYINYGKTAPTIYNTNEVTYGYYIITGERLTLILPNE